MRAAQSQLKLLRHRPLAAPSHARALSTRVVAAKAPADEVLRSISVNGEVAVLVARATGIVGDAASRQRTSPTATAAVGRAMVAGVLLCGFRRENEQVQVTFRGDGELGQLSVIADSRCRVKAYVSNPSCDPPLRPDGKLNVGGAVGRGTLTVVRLNPDLPPYSGTVELVSGEIGDDCAHYLQTSEQQSSCAVGLGVKLNRSLDVVAAGGFLVQCLPFVSDETLTLLERNLTSLPPITTLLSEGLDPAAVTERILAGLGVSEGAQTRIPSYGPCDENDLRARMQKACLALGADELRRIYDAEGKLEVRCDYCCTTLQLDGAALIAAASKAAAAA